MKNNSHHSIFVLVMLLAISLFFIVCDKDNPTGARELDPDIEIFPGIGAAGIKIGDPWSSVTKTLGGPNRLWLHRFNNQLYSYDGDWDDLGVSVKFIPGNQTQQLTTDKVVSIKVESPYSKKTEKGIKIGSSLTEVVNAYGEPGTISSLFKYYFYNTGIEFYYNSDSTHVVSIEILSSR